MSTWSLKARALCVIPRLGYLVLWLRSCDTITNTGNHGRAPQFRPGLPGMMHSLSCVLFRFLTPWVFSDMLISNTSCVVARRLELHIRVSTARIGCGGGIVHYVQKIKGTEGTVLAILRIAFSAPLWHIYTIDM